MDRRLAELWLDNWQGRGSDEVASCGRRFGQTIGRAVVDRLTVPGVRRGTELWQIIWPDGWP